MTYEDYAAHLEKINIEQSILAIRNILENLNEKEEKKRKLYEKHIARLEKLLAMY